MAKTRKKTGKAGDSGAARRGGPGGPGGPARRRGPGGSGGPGRPGGSGGRAGRSKAPIRRDSRRDPRRGPLRGSPRDPHRGSHGDSHRDTLSNASREPRGDEPTTPFLRACRGLLAEHTPIWLMRQAGRYMKEYRALRAKHSMLEMIETPDLAAEVTLQPIDKFGFDAAVIFSDILPPLMGMGLEIEFVDGAGPTINNPISRPKDIDALRTPSAQESMPATLKAIELVNAELSPRGIPVIGFAGAPFTLACYAIEGGRSRSFAKVKTLMYTDPDAWDRLMTKLVAVQADYLIAQAEAGAAALHLFDSWAGIALGERDYLRYVRLHNASLFSRLQPTGVPVVNYSNGTSAFIEDVAACGGDVIGVDWRMPLDWAWEQIGFDMPIQGNLDPVALLAPWPELQERADDVMKRAVGKPGHIFNLGHGVLPDTPPDNVSRLVDFVHSWAPPEKRG